ncbi:pyridoxal-phosphate dependent enzyme [Streptomyces phyllanthi]|uniref:pyridoxal-phosphate dependent enzyme n=1 Tax=Streptomyces phyllanthi TaxID=1803180 RepID=UPI002AD46D98|nr:pyridoxal-phosphate dependent enzyme [Streptomyces phyllanthi]
MDRTSERTVAAFLRNSLRPTPTVTAAFEYRGKHCKFLLKLEGENITGSIKDRTASGLILMLERERPLTPGTVVIESTSGNLGIAMASLLRQIDCRCIAVIDPRTPAATRERLSLWGAETVLIDEPDQYGGYLVSRLREVARLLDGNPGYRWPDQYRNHANPRIHELTTGREIAEQGGPACDGVYVAVSTGGTLAGVSSYLRRHRPDMRIVAVDAVGSQAITDSTGRRLVPGIGSSLRSSFLDETCYDDFAAIGAAESFAMCRVLRDDLKITVGGSSGSVIYAMVTGTGRRETSLPMCLCPDDGTKYLDTFYSDRWLADIGLLDQTTAAIDRLRSDGLSFRPERSST